ncbi:hypothetical protein [Marinitenerispora sediminis]|uniref:Uncharacterized protein n=1 Tax=Marinitenerispora sediminis TaxID=1931232 RepID=A0A368T6D6_9ACTN|nr:hypothetical protein [Marinitenerispora sediminis]RCV53455.1 hypothetical protein DEF23_17400 [Marinitenerispora sediminis]RCV59283.1 hypothetical protein DEF24_09940 [Marinitenerispora sediminis]
MLHFTALVIPEHLTGHGYATPVVVLGADTATEISEIPLVTSLHRIEYEVVPYVHATPVLGRARVSQIWVDAVELDYDRRAKIVVVREPVPGDIDTSYANPATGVTGEDLPPWMRLLLAGQLHLATRDVPVSSGRSAMDVAIDAAAPTTLPEWAQQER